MRGQPDDVVEVRETRHGPVLSDLDPAGGGPVLAVAMASLQPHDTAADGLAALNRAQRRSRRPGRGRGRSSRRCRTCWSPT